MLSAIAVKCKVGGHDVLSFFPRLIALTAYSSHSAKDGFSYVVFLLDALSIFFTARFEPWIWYHGNYALSLRNASFRKRDYILRSWIENTRLKVLNARVMVQITFA